MPAAQTYEPLATTTLGSNTTTVTFSSISGSYTDLILVANGTVTYAGNLDCEIFINSDTGTNYSRTYMFGNGTSALSGKNTSAAAALGFYWSNTQSNNTIFHFMNYSNTTTYKTMLTRNANPGNSTYAGVGMWRSTSAITRLDLTPTASSQWATGSIFTLYGITAA
jgi:hypothetical protein